MILPEFPFRFFKKKSVGNTQSVSTSQFKVYKVPRKKTLAQYKKQNNNQIVKTRNQKTSKKITRVSLGNTAVLPTSVVVGRDKIDNQKRNFLKIAGVASAGLIASQLIPKKAEALIMGSTPSSSVVGVKDDSNVRINPATEETLASILEGQSVEKLSINLSVSGNILTPGSGKKIRVYSSRFSLTADATSVSFRFTSGGTDHEKYVSPKTGGLYGANNHPNYVEGGVNEVLYCVISGTTTIQINVDYLEV